MQEGSRLMRGADERSGSMFRDGSREDRVSPDHPLRTIRRMTDRALERLSPRFGTRYIQFGRPSIAPEQLVRALRLQARRGRVTRVSHPATRRPRGRAGAPPPSIVAANGGPTRRTNRRPILTRGCTGTRTAVRRNWLTPGIC
jgi:hypothetical protein